MVRKTYQVLRKYLYSKEKLTGDDIMSSPMENCPIHKVLELFQGKWTVRILYELRQKENLRFGELKKAIPGISSTMLSASLKDLEEKGLIERIQFNEIPPHVEYKATEKAKDLRIVFSAMNEWGMKYL